MPSGTYKSLQGLNIFISLQFAPKISPQSAKHVHHMLVFLCEDMNLTGHRDVGVEKQCDHISEEVQPCRLSRVLAGWTVGGNVSYIQQAVVVSF